MPLRSGVATAKRCIGGVPNRRAEQPVCEMGEAGAQAMQHRCAPLDRTDAGDIGDDLLAEIKAEQREFEVARDTFGQTCRRTTWRSSAGRNQPLQPWRASPAVGNLFYCVGLTTSDP
jgi:hypothetical protein